MRSTCSRISWILALPLILGGGCTTPPGEAESRARDQIAAAAAIYRPGAARPDLSGLRRESSLPELIRFAVLRHPGVEAAWHDWRASVEAIGPARALPDPRLTFEADIMKELRTFMPGLMFDLMNGGKRDAMAREMAAGSEVAQREFSAQVQRAALAMHRAWVDLVYADEALDLHAAMLAAFDDAAATAAADYATARSMASMEAQVRLLNEASMHHTEHHATADVRMAARARFKAALGLTRDDPNPPWPRAQLTPTELPERDALWARVLAANPDLAVMRAMVDMTLAGREVADRTRRPEFMVGTMIDLKASPLMVRPTASMSLPIWRDRISATIAAAGARHEASVARVSAMQIELAAELAQMIAMVQEADEMLTYIDDVALPNLETVAATAAASYQAGMASATMISETRAMALELRVKRLMVLRQRENTMAELLALTGGVAPDEVSFAQSSTTP